MVGMRLNENSPVFMLSTVLARNQTTTCATDNASGRSAKNTHMHPKSRSCTNPAPLAHMKGSETYLEGELNKSSPCRQLVLEMGMWKWMSRMGACKCPAIMLVKGHQQQEGRRGSQWVSKQDGVRVWPTELRITPKTSTGDGSHSAP